CQEFGRVLVDMIALEQLDQKRMRAAADRSDGHLPALQFAQRCALQDAAMEDPQRLVEQRSQRLELGRLFTDAAALNQPDIPAGARVTQELQVFQAACRRDE